MHVDTIYMELPILYVKGSQVEISQLEDLKVLKGAPDLLNNVKIGEGQLRLII